MTVNEQVVDLAAVRRWVRHRQAAHRDNRSALSTVYFAVLLSVVVVSLLWPVLRAVFWPQIPAVSLLTAVSAALVCFGVVYQVLRQLGPLAVSRPTASWLLTAPVSRRSLLLPRLAGAAAASAGVGAAVTGALVGQVVARPVTGSQLAVAVTFGALAGVATLLVALAGQAGRRLRDAPIYLVAGLGFAGLLIGARERPETVDGAWLSDLPAVSATAVLAVIVAVSTVRAVSRLPRTPNEDILDAARTTGTLFDSAYAVEPSFVTDMLERRHWPRAELRSRRFSRRLPALTAHDLHLLQRRPRRLILLFAAAFLPALAAPPPGWLLPGLVLAGAMIAAATTAATVRTDTGNPVLLRLLARSSRDAVGQRLGIPTMLAGLWCAAALLLTGSLSEMPPGPWWALGAALGPVGAVAAVRRARLGLVRHDLPPLQTPFGTITPGPLLAAMGGLDALLLGLPAAAQLASGTSLTWTLVLVQTLVSVAGTWGYLAATTSPEHVEFTAGRASSHRAKAGRVIRGVLHWPTQQGKRTPS